MVVVVVAAAAVSVVASDQFAIQLIAPKFFVSDFACTQDTAEDMKSVADIPEGGLEDTEEAVVVR